MDRGSEAAEARRLVYRALSALFLYPDDERLASLAASVPDLRRRTGPLRALTVFPAWERVLSHLPARAGAEAERVREEYTGLFVAGTKGSCQPYESAHLTPDPREAPFVSSDVEVAYAQAGLAVGGAAAGELPDHVAVELDFLSFLCGREEEAATDEEAATWRVQQHAFLHDHLLRWLPRFATRVAAVAPDGLYRHVAEAARAFAEHDVLLLEALQAAG